MARKGGAPENLILCTEWTPEQRRERQLKTKETKEKQKLFRQMCQEMLNNIDKESGKTNREVVMEELFKRAKKGDTKALSLMYKMSGEDVAKVEVVGNAPIKVDLTK